MKDRGKNVGICYNNPPIILYGAVSRYFSATLVVLPIQGENDKKRSQLNKAVTQPLAPGLL